MRNFWLGVAIGVVMGWVSVVLVVRGTARRYCSLLKALEREMTSAEIDVLLAQVDAEYQRRHRQDSE